MLLNKYKNLIIIITFFVITYFLNITSKNINLKCQTKNNQKLIQNNKRKINNKTANKKINKIKIRAMKMIKMMINKEVEIKIKMKMIKNNQEKMLIKINLNRKMINKMIIKNYPLLTYLKDNHLLNLNLHLFSVKYQIYHRQWIILLAPSIVLQVLDLIEDHLLQIIQLNNQHISQDFKI